MRVPLSRQARTRRRATPWYEADGGARLAADQARVAASDYRSLAFRIDQKERRCVLEGDLVFGSQSGIRTPVAVRILFPHEYPRLEPVAYDAGTRFVHDADGHFVSDEHNDGRCCLWLNWESGWSPEDPDALLRFLDQVAVFFHRQLVFEAGGRTRWPGPERGHGADGYYEFLREALSVDDASLRSLLPALEQFGSFRRYGMCPCGSRRPYRECHFERIAEIVHRVGRWELERRIARWRRAGYPGLSSGTHPVDQECGVGAEQPRDS